MRVKIVSKDVKWKQIIIDRDNHVVARILRESIYAKHCDEVLLIDDKMCIVVEIARSPNAVDAKQAIDSAKILRDRGYRVIGILIVAEKGFGKSANLIRAVLLNITKRLGVRAGNVRMLRVRSDIEMTVNDKEVKVRVW